MSTKRVHAPPPTRWALDGRETDLLHYIFSRPDLNELKGNPSNVLAAIDEYNQNHNMLMNIGPRKGKFISDLIAKQKPSTMIELGGYVGYSAILFGDTLRSNGGKQYLSLEINPEMVAVASVLVDLAGLRDFVSFIIGPCNETLIKLVRSEKKISQIELLFIDHWQELYLPDLWLIEELNILKPGVSVLVADNVIFPGAPQYLEWVRASPAQKKEMVEKRKLALSKDGDTQLINDSAADSKRVLGNPNIVYETSTTEFEFGPGKDGVEVTRVVGEETM
ncbi:putative O-methyltransferase [Xylogone sp. PMI_703]|nr:putative O-methyltransferase [Xylogone sp. PMI_703]